MDICYIVNPTAGKGKGKIVARQIESYMENTGIPYEIRFTTMAKEAEFIAKKAALEGFEKIVSVGGDGTIYEVLNGIIGLDVSLGVIPAGTGNDFARHIGVQGDLEKALKTITHGDVRAMDCGLINGRYFLNVAGIGFDTEVLKEVEQLKKHLKGTWAYLAGLFKALLRYKYKKVDINMDGIQYKKEILLMAFANGKFYGGGMKISPSSSTEDGYIDICIIDKISKWRILGLFPTIFTGRHINVKEVQMYKAKRVNLKSEVPLDINLDGDLVGCTPLVMEVKPGAMNFMVPRKNFENYCSFKE